MQYFIHKITPITKAMIMAKTKLKVFLIRVNFNPNSLFSMGNVTTPTIVKVVRKATTGTMLAPACTKEPARGKATKAGIKVIHPTRAKTMVVIRELVWPAYCLTASGGIKVRIRPIKNKIARISPPICFIIPVDILTELIVVCLSFIMEKTNQITVISQNTIVKISILTTSAF